MTEDEAKTKWCPFAKSRVLTMQLDESGKKQQAALLVSGALSTQCIASKCMAWREEKVFDKLNIAQGQSEYKINGYCGLAGKC